MFRTREPNPPDIRAALDLVTVVQMAIGEKVHFLEPY
jgi:hypothetical protein